MKTNDVNYEPMQQARKMSSEQLAPLARLSHEDHECDCCMNCAAHLVLAERMAAQQLDRRDEARISHATGQRFRF